MEEKQFTYKQAGVDIDVADTTKKEMAKSLATNDARVLNKLGAFASLFDGHFPDLKHPVLVLKTEEPGSKQKLAFKYGRIRAICHDMINHLVNDIIVMGAKPLSVQDAIICGKLDQDIVNILVDEIACACRENGCVLTGGETSEQPGVVAEGTYILTSSIVGVVDKEKIIDGSKIKEGDVVVAAASNGIHTNGYSLIRALMDHDKTLIDEEVAGESFLDVILRPHKSYYQEFKGLFQPGFIHGAAHITGGGIAGNLGRILPADYSALVALDCIEVLPVFKLIKEKGNIADAEMLKTFNMGVGMVLVVDAELTAAVTKDLNNKGCRSYEIGRIVKGDGQVKFTGDLNW